jgi:hypothetical protein
MRPLAVCPGADQITGDQNEKAPCQTQGANFHIRDLFNALRTLRARQGSVKGRRVRHVEVGSIRLRGCGRCNAGVVMRRGERKC